MKVIKGVMAGMLAAIAIGVVITACECGGKNAVRTAETENRHAERDDPCSGALN